MNAKHIRLIVPLAVLLVFFFAFSKMFPVYGSPAEPRSSVVGVDPDQNALAVNPSSTIAATFNTVMNPTTITTSTIKAYGEYSGRLAGTVTYNSATQTATLDPTAQFKPGEAIWTSLTHAITSDSGDPLVPMVWQFSTQAQVSTGDFFKTGNYPAGGDPFDIELGDLDQDGDLDMVVPHGQPGDTTISVLFNNGDGSFKSPVNYATGEGPYPLALADLDSDGDLDVAVPNHYDNNVRVMINNGSGIFTLSETYATATEPHYLKARDLDGDGDIDVVIGNEKSANVSVLLNSGDGTFAPQANYTTGSGPNSLDVGDLDSDGDLDLVTANGFDNSISVLLNSGDATFTPRVDYGTGTTPGVYGLGDMDKDGDLDIVLTMNGNSAAVLFNNGHAVFAAPVPYIIESSPGKFSLSDLDGDNDLDLAVTSWNSGKVSVLFNNGDGTLLPQATYDVGPNLHDVASGDLDGDGDLDLAVTVFGTREVAVLKNNNGGISLSGRVTVTTRDGNPLPGVTISATGNGTTITTTTDLNGEFTLTDLAGGTYTLIPYRDGYAFDDPSRVVPVMSNTTGVDFIAYLLSITYIEINQGLGNVDQYVAGKDTVVRVSLNRPILYDKNKQWISLEQNGQPTTNTLTPLPFNHAFASLTFISADPSGNPWRPQGGDNTSENTYTLKVSVNGATATASEVFQDRRSIRILAIPIMVNEVSPTDSWRTANKFLEQVYPVPSGILNNLVLGIEQEYSGPDLNDDEGQQAIFNLLSEQYSNYNKINKDPVDFVLGFLPPMEILIDGKLITGRSSTSLPLAWILSNGSFTKKDGEEVKINNMEYIVSHEIGHKVGTSLITIGGESVKIGLGDEYDGGAFRCDVNPAPKNYKSKDGINCSDEHVEDFGGGLGTKVVSDVDHPFAILSLSGNDDCIEINRNNPPCLLIDKLAFMGSSDEPLKYYWISPAEHRYLFSHLQVNLSAQMLRYSDRVVQAYGWISKEGNIELLPWYSYIGNVSVPISGTYIIEAVDPLGQVLAWQGFEVSFVTLTDPPEDLDIAPFNALVAFPEGTTAFNIRHGNTLLQSVPVSQNPPQVTVVSPNGGETWEANGDYAIQWQGDDSDGDPLTYSVLYSPDGSDWSVVTVGITGTQTIVHASEIAGSNSAIVRVIATDGVNTTSDESDAVFSVGRKIPWVTILSPTPVSIYVPGDPFYLHGYAYDREDGQLDDQSFYWSSNRDGDLGTGSVVLANLSPGEHTIILTSTDSDGNSATASINIYVGHRVYLPMTTHQSQASSAITKEIVPASRAVATPIPYYAIAILGIAATGLVLKHRK